ncbi:MAG: hypothetical protein WBW94_02270 [Anaerolineales bacterium]
MADLKFFIQQGWNNIWKQKTIWLFSALSVLFNFLGKILPNQISTSFWYFVITVLIEFVIFISVAYDGYCYINGNEATARETLLAVRKFISRVLGCSLLILIPFVVLLCLVATIFSRLFIANFQNSVNLLYFPFYIMLTPLTYFSIAEFFAKNAGIRQTLKRAWVLIKKHFPILFMLALIRESLIVAYNMAVATFTVLIQSGFNSNSLSKVNYLNPYSPLSGNLLYGVISNLALLVIFPVSVSVFMLAYQKYSQAMSDKS